jgi:hypothetical protein
MNATVNDADLIAQRVLDDYVTVSTDDVFALAQAYRRVVEQRDDWKARHDVVFEDRESLRRKVEELDT